MSRWHDKSQDLAESVERLCSFPYPLQTILGSGVSQLAESRYQAAERMRCLTVLEPQKAKGVFKATLKKNRPYDKNPELFKAINYLYVLSEDKQLEMARQVLQLVHFISTYMQFCEHYQLPPSLEDVSLMTFLYVKNGPAATENFMIQLLKELNSASGVQRRISGLLRSSV